MVQDQKQWRIASSAPITIKATAAKLARLVYRMLRHGMKYVDQGMEFYQTQQRNRGIH